MICKFSRSVPAASSTMGALCPSHHATLTTWLSSKPLTALATPSKILGRRRCPSSSVTSGAAGKSSAMGSFGPVPARRAIRVPLKRLWKVIEVAEGWCCVKRVCAVAIVACPLRSRARAEDIRLSSQLLPSSNYAVCTHQRGTYGRFVSVPQEGNRAGPFPDKLTSVVGVLHLSSYVGLSSEPPCNLCENAVSERLNSAAICCASWSSAARAASSQTMTAAGFPPKGFEVKASTVVNGISRAVISFLGVQSREQASDEFLRVMKMMKIVRVKASESSYAGERID